MAKKSESTNEKIVRLYKEGHTIDEIARTMAIPKGNIAGILEKYFPDYQSYVQPVINHTDVNEEKEKGKKGVFGMNVGDLLKKGKRSAEEETPKAAINLEMGENGFVDRTVAGMAQMLKKGKPLADVAEFFNKDKSEIKAVQDLMDEHFKRMEASQAPAQETAAEDAPVEEKGAFGRGKAFTTGLEEEKPVKHKYVPPTYTKRDDPKPVSASYGLAEDSKPIEDVKPVENHNDPISLLDTPAPTKNIDLVAESQKPESTDIDLVAESQKPASADIDLVAESQKPASANIDLVAETSAPETHDVKLVPDSAEPEKADQKKTVSLTEEVPEMPSIEPISLDYLDKELKKAPAPVSSDIPAIGGINTTSAGADNSKEDNSGMSPMEKMRQFAQEQIALNNQKIEELKNKKVDAENTAFDCNTKVEAMKKQIEEMQAQLKVLIEEKTKAGDIVGGINDEIEAVNKENAEYSTYL